MARGKGKNTQVNNVASRQQTTTNPPLVDQNPDQEQWHLLPGSKNIYVSVEQAPRHYQSDVQWQYRATVIQTGGEFPQGFKTLNSITSQSNPQDTVWQAVTPIVTDKRRQVVFEQQDVAKLLGEDAPPLHLPRQGRIKDVPQPEELQEISLQADREAEVISSVEDQDNPYDEYQEVEYQYHLGGYALKDDKLFQRYGMETENVPANFSGTPKQIFVVTSTYDDVETFGSTLGQKIFLFAFDKREAADEYVEYVSNASQFQRGYGSEIQDLTVEEIELV